MKKKVRVKVTNSKDQKAEIDIVMDFAGVETDTLYGWAISNRVIAFQRVLRSLTRDEIEALDGTTIRALDAGKKIRSREDRIKELVNAGLSREVAELAVDNPSALDAVVKDNK